MDNSHHDENLFSEYTTPVSVTELEEIKAKLQVAWETILKMPVKERDLGTGIVIAVAARLVVTLEQVQQVCDEKGRGNEGRADDFGGLLAAVREVFAGEPQ